MHVHEGSPVYLWKQAEKKCLPQTLLELEGCHPRCQLGCLTLATQAAHRPLSDGKLKRLSPGPVIHPSTQQWRGMIADGRATDSLERYSCRLLLLDKSTVKCRLALTVTAGARVTAVTLPQPHFSTIMLVFCTVNQNYRTRNTYCIHKTSPVK